MAEDYTTATFLTALLRSTSSAIQPFEASESDHAKPKLNPFSNDTLSPPARKLLLTLHVLYPTQFLPALDILDRHLLTRLIPPSPQPPTSDPPSASRSTRPVLYLVGSTGSATATMHPAHDGSASTGRFHDVLAPQVYEVRPLAWNCSCPAFAFAAFPAGGGDDDAEGEIGEAQEVLEWLPDDNDALGGLLRGKGSNNLPVCKHLLACVLVERIDALRAYAEEKRVSWEEIAGWSAGWGS